MSCPSPAYRALAMHDATLCSPPTMPERPPSMTRQLPHHPILSAPCLPTALCAEAPDPDLWFGPSGSMEEAAAVSICRRCPSVDHCRAWAIEAGVRDGVWGGLSEWHLRKAVARANRAQSREARAC